MQDDQDWLVERFAEHRDRLRGVAARMLGSRTAADDAVQETWLRLRSTDADAVENLGGWLTTVVSRVSIDMLRARHRGDAPLPATDDVWVDDRVADPVDDVVVADSVSAALLVVLETLSPSERLAFVLHDTFKVPFEEIADILGRSTAATKQLAHRARTKVRLGPDVDASVPETDRQREVVDAFLAASRDGNLAGLIELLDPDIVMDADQRAAAMGAEARVEGREAVASVFSGRALGAQAALIDGVAGMVWATEGQLRVVWDFSIEDGVVTHIDMLADPDTLGRLQVTPT